MERRLFLDVVVRQSATVLQLLASEDQALLIWRNAFLVLDLGLDVVDRVTSLYVQRDSLASQGLHEDLHASSQAQDKMERRFFLDVVVGQGATVLQLLASEDQALLIWGNSFF